MIDANILGVIHARGGSKRIPMKNIKPLHGKPLIAWMIEAAKASESLDRIIVSTDHPDIGQIAMGYGAEVPFYRPKELAMDCPSEYVTKHAVEFVEEEQGSELDIVVSMQPTTPFCLGRDIDECLRLLNEHSRWGSVFTGSIVRERPEWMFHYHENSEAKLFYSEVLRGDTGVVQRLPPLAIPNGAAYVTRRKTLFQEGALISENTGIHLMPLDRSVDIDEPLDFDFAEFIAERKELHDE